MGDAIYEYFCAKKLVICLFFLDIEEKKYSLTVWIRDRSASNINQSTYTLVKQILQERKTPLLSYMGVHFTTLEFEYK